MDTGANGPRGEVTELVIWHAALTKAEKEEAAAALPVITEPQVRMSRSRSAFMQLRCTPPLGDPSGCCSVC